MINLPPADRSIRLAVSLAFDYSDGVSEARDALKYRRTVRIGARTAHGGGERLDLTPGAETSDVMKGANARIPEEQIALELVAGSRIALDRYGIGAKPGNDVRRC